MRSSYTNFNISYYFTICYLINLTMVNGQSITKRKIIEIPNLKVIWISDNIL